MIPVECSYCSPKLFGKLIAQLYRNERAYSVLMQARIRIEISHRNACGLRDSFNEQFQDSRIGVQ